MFGKYSPLRVDVKMWAEDMSHVRVYLWRNFLHPPFVFVANACYDIELEFFPNRAVQVFDDKELTKVLHPDAEVPSRSLAVTRFDHLA